MNKSNANTKDKRSWIPGNQNFLLEGNPEAGSAHHNFEQQYLSLRGKENRIYSDEELTSLPFISKVHPHFKEWVLRQHSLKTLSAYLKNKQKFLEILEVGCGNGWLSNQLSLHVSCQVTGLDINRSELEQAAKVFRPNTECTFVYGDIYAEVLSHKKFDVIIFAASLQYFRSLKEIISASRKLLKHGGELVILDTHFYRDSEVAEAHQRSASHFNALGSPVMATMYFHHSMNEIKQFQPVTLYNPYSLKNRFFRRTSPFYQLSIAKE